MEVIQVTPYTIGTLIIVGGNVPGPTSCGASADPINAYLYRMGGSGGPGGAGAEGTLNAESGAGSPGGTSVSLNATAGSTYYSLCPIHGFIV